MSSSDPGARPGPAPVGPGQELELTLRALIAGCGIGAVLALANVTMGLRTGFSDTGGITSAVLGFGLFRALGRVGRGYTTLENNITQTAAASAAIMPATMGYLGGLPALELLGHGSSHLGLFAWGLALALLGILIALPLRNQFVEREQLPFPSAAATAELIRAMHKGGTEALARARALLAAAGGTMALVWFRDGRPAFIPPALWVPGRIGDANAQALTLGASVSPMMISIGMLVGPRIGLSMLAGGLVAWMAMAPQLVRAGIAQASYDSLVGWLLWPGAALMIGGALTGLAQQTSTIRRALGDLRKLGGHGSRNPGGRGPMLLAAVLSLATALIGWVVFGVSPLVVLAGVVLTFVLGAVCVRSAGETDIIPLLSMGQLSQMILGAVAPGSAVGNIVGASVVAGCAGQTAGTMISFKAGRLLDASPGRQVIAQVAGAFAGAAVAAPAYALVTRAWAIGSPSLPAPTASPWKVLAELAERGSTALPEHAAVGSLAGLVVGVVLAVLGRSRFASFVPSPLALGVAFLVPATYTITIAAGSLLFALLEQRRRSWTEVYAPSIAAGGIAGESLASIVVAALVVAGVLG